MILPLQTYQGWGTFVLKVPAPYTQLAEPQGGLLCWQISRSSIDSMTGLPKGLAYPLLAFPVR